jgi:hypothetical protein
MLRAMNELTLASYGKIRQQVQSVKDTRVIIDREQDKLIQQLSQVDTIEKTLTQLENASSDLMATVRRISNSSIIQKAK